jgi:hypothetical protein
MQLALRRAYYGFSGLGQSGETDVEGGALPGGTVETGPTGSSEEFLVYTQTDPIPFGTAADCADLSLWSSVSARNAACYPIVTGAPTAPGAELSPAEMEAEQIRARAWLSTLNLPATITAGTHLALTAAQIASGLKAGTLKPSSTCPGGYLVSGTGQCAQASATATGSQILPGVSNQTLAIGLLVLLMFMGGRRR